MTRYQWNRGIALITYNIIGLRHQNPHDEERVWLQCWCSSHPHKILSAYETGGFHTGDYEVPVFRDVNPCSLVEAYWHVTGTCYLIYLAEGGDFLSHVCTSIRPHSITTYMSETEMFRTTDHFLQSDCDLHVDLHVSTTILEEQNASIFRVKLLGSSLSG